MYIIGMKAQLAAAAFTALAVLSAVGKPSDIPQIPGPLSAAHAAKPGEADCAACHASPDQVSPAKCLACHKEIAERVAAGTGYHRDKGQDCALCHAEHQGREAGLVPMERVSFDHAETGADLRGAHTRAKDCDACHTPANSLPRTKGRSYLFLRSGCRVCHATPHPGRQDACLKCHGQDNWRVTRRAGSVGP